MKWSIANAWITWQKIEKWVDIQEGKQNKGLTRIQLPLLENESVEYYGSLIMEIKKLKQEYQKAKG